MKTLKQDIEPLVPVGHPYEAMARKAILLAMQGVHGDAEGYRKLPDENGHAGPKPKSAVQEVYPIQQGLKAFNTEGRAPLERHSVHDPIAKDYVSPSDSRLNHSR